MHISQGSCSFQKACSKAQNWEAGELEPVPWLTPRWLGRGRLTVLRHLQDVAEQRAVAVEGLGPRQVDGPSFCGAEGRHGVLGGVRKLPGGEIWWGHL